MRKPNYCKGCTHYNTGKLGTRWEHWCCHHGQNAIKIWKHCKQVGGKREIKWEIQDLKAAYFSTFGCRQIIHDGKTRE